MKTAALLPTPGDPLVAKYWLRNYEQVWKGEVDEVRVAVNGNEESVMLYDEADFAVMSVPYRLGHGEALDLLLSMTDADKVVFVEDDAFVLRPGVIHERLQSLLPEEIIGCPRGGMDPVLHIYATQKWGEVSGPDGSTGHGLWPCFLFAHAADLRRCGTFASKTWHKDETIPGLDFHCSRDMGTDTMTSAAFLMRDQFTIRPDVQYKELWQKEYPQSDPPPWLHAGGLSNDITAGRSDIGMDNLEGKDWAHRLWWLRRMGHDVSEHAKRMNVDPDYWNEILGPWITWGDQ